MLAFLRAGPTEWTIQTISRDPHTIKNMIKTPNPADHFFLTLNSMALASEVMTWV
jgi:hypothetical protein